MQRVFETGLIVCQYTVRSTIGYHSNSWVCC